MMEAGKRRVCVTGMGVRTSIGSDVAEFAAALRAGSCGIRDLGGTAPGHLCANLAPLSLRDSLQRLPLVPKPLGLRALACAGRAPLAAQVAVQCALEAWGQAGLFQHAIEPATVSLVVAGQNIQPAYAYGLHEKFRSAPDYLPPSYALHFLDTDHLGILSELLKIHGEGMTAGGASASGNIGIIQGLRQIRAGLCEVCVVVGALADLSPMELQALHGIGALGGRGPDATAQAACRPFDADRDGFIYGQGAGCLILESEASARRRGAAVLAELAGGAIRLDGSRLASPSQAGETLAMRCALRDAGLQPQDIDYISAHATSTVAGDLTEALAIKEVFGDSLSRVFINATKGLTGHCLWSAGVIEAIATIIQLRDGFVHPNLNLLRPIDSDCRFVGSHSAHAPLRTALSNSFGFGGINTAVAITRALGPHGEEG